MALTPYSVSPRRNDHRVGPKPTKYWVDLHAEALGGEHVPGLVQADRDQDAEREQRRPRARRSCACSSRSSRVTAAAGTRRAPRSLPARTSATTARFLRPRRACSRRPRPRCRRCRERQPPVAERRHALLVGRVVDGGRGAAGRPAALRAARTAGKALVVERDELPGAAPWSSRSRRRPRRPGPASPAPSAIGSRMSGGLAWASVEPSTNSTIEWTTDCGCTTTSMRS